MLTSAAQRESSELILREAGYSAAWMLKSTDKTETGFLVPLADLDWIPPHESPLMRQTCIALMGVFPGTKVFIIPYEADLAAERFYQIGIDRFRANKVATTGPLKWRGVWLPKLVAESNLPKRRHGSFWTGLTDLCRSA